MSEQENVLGQDVSEEEAAAAFLEHHKNPETPGTGRGEKVMAEEGDTAKKEKPDG